MASTSQIGVGIPLEAVRSTRSIETAPAAIADHGAHAITARAIFPAIDDRPGGPLSWLQLLRASSIWETALIAVLFLLISWLVGLRVAEALSERGAGIAPLRSPTTDANESDESDESNTTDETERSRTHDHRAYEHYLSPETPPELLSDEGRVVRLLVANQGRIRQHQIADETGWSKSKVSRICSQMSADGTIEKRSVGRENVIILRDGSSDEDRSDDVENPLP
ncbi:helix-turn-helix transcriptional regulator [Halosolutus gelatinilyticus]|uniref:helix-turn-helix transcriptional regulator n=1 Tax=Halosolutus gelatinilyticus TaxID=2931975 RepID=UPI001FF51CA3|nr:helix-turn-helix domain-containing protein [Halosolutus gelatinilyticus]